MISGYSIGNFQAIGKMQHVPIKPITLIFGPNGAGKSSLLKSLLVAQQAIQSNSISKDGTSHPMHPGSFRDYARFGRNPFRERPREDVFPWDYAEDVHYVEPSWPVLLRLSVNRIDQSREQNTLSVEVHFREGTLFIDHPVSDLFIRLNDTCLIRWALDNSGDFVLKYIDGAQFPDIESLHFKNLAQLDIVSELFRMPASEFLPREWLRENAPLAAGSAYLRGLMEGLSAFLNESNACETHSKATDLQHQLKRAQSDVAPRVREAIAEAYKKLIEAADSTFASLIYHGPLRPIPPTFLDLGSDNSPGLNAWRKVALEPEIQDKINNWLSSTAFSKKYRVEFDRLILDSNLECIASIIADLKSEHALARWGSQNYLERNFAALKGTDLIAEEMVRARAEGKGKHDDDREYFDEDDAWQEVHRRFWHDCYPLFEKAVAEGELYEFAVGAMKDLSWILGEKLSDARYGERTNFVRVKLVDVATGQKVSLKNIGVGFSQMLPILASAFGSKDSLIVVEQPELHVHPALQAEVADVFIESALGPSQNRFLLETHSEHLILRILRRIRETTAGKEVSFRVTHDDVAVLYVKPGPDGSEVVELQVTPDGDFAQPWPDGFFPERAKELF